MKAPLPKLPSKEVMQEYYDLKLGLSDEELLKLWFMGYPPSEVRAMKQHPAHLLAYGGINRD